MLNKEVEAVAARMRILGHSEGYIKALTDPATANDDKINTLEHNLKITRDNLERSQKISQDKQTRIDLLENNVKELCNAKAITHRPALIQFRYNIVSILQAKIRSNNGVLEETAIDDAIDIVRDIYKKTAEAYSER